MICPKCKTDLSERRFGETAIHLCSRCEGVWLADDTLRHYLRVAAAAQGTPKKAISLVETPAIATDLRCPRCSDTQLERLKYRAVEVDRCPSCRGIFLDHGELQRIAERTLRAERQAADITAKPRVRSGGQRKSHPVLRGVADSGLPDVLGIAAAAMLGN